MTNNQIQKQAQAEGNLASDPDMQTHIETDKEWLDELEETIRKGHLFGAAEEKEEYRKLPVRVYDRLISMARTNDTIKENMYWEGHKQGGIKMEDDLGSRVERYEKVLKRIVEDEDNYGLHDKRPCDMALDALEETKNG